MTTENHSNDKIVQIVKENLNLSDKQAIYFADKARALQRNLKLRKKQKEEIEKQKNEKK